MPRALVLQHVAHEGPARVSRAFGAAGFELDTLRLDRDAHVPDSLDDWQALIVMGGPMGVGDVGDARYPFLGAELALLRHAVARNVPTLGICLGAQLLAAAAGARVFPNVTGDPPRLMREVGWGAVHFVENAHEEPVLAGLDAAEIVLHWHGDTFDLPSGAVLLASTLSCENQMFRLGARQFGLQFHVELEQADVMRWLQSDADYVRSALGAHGVERIAADTRRFFTRFEQRGDRLLENLVASMRV